MGEMIGMAGVEDRRASGGLQSSIRVVGED